MTSAGEPSTVDALLAGRERFLAFVAKRVGRDHAEDVLQTALARAVAHADAVPPAPPCRCG